MFNFLLSYCQGRKELQMNILPLVQLDKDTLLDKTVTLGMRRLKHPPEVAVLPSRRQAGANDKKLLTRA
ncbi:Nonribosomal peptide synthetase TES [Trichinella pseudospiralis]